MCCYIKNFCLDTPMEYYEYISLPLNITLEDMIKKYNIRAVDKNGHVYGDIRTGMYGLPQE